MRDTFRLRNAPVYGAILTILFTLGIVFLPTDWLGRWFTDDPLATRFIGRSIVRLVGTGFLLYLMYTVGYREFSWNRRLLPVIPLFIVAVNNLPVIALATGAARVDNAALVPLFALECLSVALFEETAFRGLVFPFMLKAFAGRKHRDFWAIVVSSCLFGLLHLVNLSAGVGPTLLQVGYSALIGAVGALIVLYARNLPAAVLFHGTYNFCGYLIPDLGSGETWDVPTVVLTVAVACAVAVYAVFLLIKTPPGNAAMILGEDGQDTDAQGGRSPDTQAGGDTGAPNEHPDGQDGHGADAQDTDEQGGLDTDEK